MMRTLTLPSRSWPSRIGVVLIALILLGLTVQTGLGYVLANTAPPLAYRIDPGNPDVAAAQANYLVRTSTSPAMAKTIEGLARDAIADAPIAPFAMRNYGFAVLAQGRKDEARSAVELAGRLSMRDFLTHAWLLDQRYLANQIGEAIYEADVLLRQRTSTYEQVMPMIVKLLADPRTVDPLARALARRPIWRGAFLETMGQKPDDFDNKIALLLALKRLGAPADSRELTPVFRSAWNKTDPRELRRRWDQLVVVPQEARSGLLIDGGFEVPALPPPFTWSYFSNQEIFAEVTRSPDGGHALFASFDGARDAGFAGQQLLLAPGRYQLSGKVMGQDSVQPGQFRWTLNCAGSGGRNEIAAVPLDPALDRWTAFSATLVVPEGCTDQQLWLTAIPHDPADIASVLVDSLSLRRL